MSARVVTASPEDAAAIAALRNSAADQLTRLYGRGHWSSGATERGVLQAIRTTRVIIARYGRSIVGTLRLVTRKPWSIDTASFQPVPRLLYLVDMAVAPARQRQGIGRLLLEEARAVALAWPAQAIRLDACDAAAGAGSFYAKCGFRETGRVTCRNVPLRYYELTLQATGNQGEP